MDRLLGLKTTILAIVCNSPKRGNCGVAAIAAVAASAAGLSLLDNKEGKLKQKKIQAQRGELRVAGRPPLR